MITGEIMGTGVLGLPAAMANLGWVVGVISSLVFGVLSVYAALLLSRVLMVLDGVEVAGEFFETHSTRLECLDFERKAITAHDLRAYAAVVDMRRQ